MLISDCKKDMRVRYERPGFTKHGQEGTLTDVRSDEYKRPYQIAIQWDNGAFDEFDASVRWLVPIVSKVPANVTDPEGYAFFAKAPEGCCPCGIPRKSGRCNFH